MPRDLRRTVAVPLVFASATGLLACPQLLQDDFGALSGIGGGSDGCDRRLNCTAGNAGSGGGGGTSSGGAGATSGTGGAQSSGGSISGASGASGTSGEAGAGGERPDAGVEPPVIDVPDAEAPDPDLACWVVRLSDTTHSASNNCLGINGWNQVVTDGDTDVTLSHANGEACFEGTISNDAIDPWGAIFNLTLNNTNAWNATAAGVSGFQFEHSGPSLPPEIRVLYDDDGNGPREFCRNITPSASNFVPFSSTHPGCNPTGAMSDVTDLRFIRLALPPGTSDYDIDYCVTIRAIP